MRRVLAGLALALILLLTGCSSGPTPLQEVHEKHGSFAGLILDDGRALSLNGAGEVDVYGMDTDTMSAYLTDLGAPDSVLVHMGSTRALDGMQTASWDGITAAWTYHPDAGLDIILTLD